MENETCKASNIRLCSPLTRPKRLPMKQPTRNMICHLKKAWSRAAVDGNKWYLYTCILYALYICIIYTNYINNPTYYSYLCDSQSSGWRFSWPKGFQISEFSEIKIIINENRSEMRKCECLLKKHQHKQALSFYLRLTIHSRNSWHWGLPFETNWYTCHTIWPGKHDEQFRDEAILLSHNLIINREGSILWSYFTKIS